jgi:hypothetical protein
MWSSHPLAILQADWVSREQQAAARQLVAFLRSRATQQKALCHGFRPADPAIPIIDSAAESPFNGAKAYGMQVKVPAVVEPPAGPIIQNMLEMWNRTIGRP